jgi:hypothetical protein
MRILCLASIFLVACMSKEPPVVANERNVKTACPFEGLTLSDIKNLGGFTLAPKAPLTIDSELSAPVRRQLLFGAHELARMGGDPGLQGLDEVFDTDDGTISVTDLIGAEHTLTLYDWSAGENPFGFVVVADSVQVVAYAFDGDLSCTPEATPADLPAVTLLKTIADLEIVPTFPEPSIQKIVIQAYSANFASDEHVRQILAQEAAKFDGFEPTQTFFEPAGGPIGVHSPVFSGPLNLDDEFLPGSKTEASVLPATKALGDAVWSIMKYSFDNGADTGEKGVAIFSPDLGLLLRIGFFQSV